MCWTILLTAWTSMHIGFRLSTSSTLCATKVFSHLWFFVYGMWLFLGRQEQTSTHPSSNRLRKDNPKVQFGKSMCFIGIISRNIDEGSRTRAEMAQRQMHQISIPVCGIVPESWKRWSIMYPHSLQALNGLRYPFQVAPLPKRSAGLQFSRQLHWSISSWWLDIVERFVGSSVVWEIFTAYLACRWRDLVSLVSLRNCWSHWILYFLSLLCFPNTKGCFTST